MYTHQYKYVSQTHILNEGPHHRAVKYIEESHIKRQCESVYCEKGDIQLFKVLNIFIICILEDMLEVLTSHRNTLSHRRTLDWRIPSKILWVFSVMLMELVLHTQFVVNSLKRNSQAGAIVWTCRSRNRSGSTNFQIWGKDFCHNMFTNDNFPYITRKRVADV